MNDAELVTRASTALVDAAVTDRWDHVRDVVAHLFAGRYADDRWIERRLDATRTRLMTAGPDAFLDQYIETGQWETRFADLLDDHPEATADLQALLDEIRPTPSGSGGVAGSGGVSGDGGEGGDDGDEGRRWGPGEDFDEPPPPLPVPKWAPGESLYLARDWPSSLVEGPEPFPLEINDRVSRAIRAAVKPGVLAFNPPAEMTQGRKERVEVVISRHVDLLDALVADLEGPGQVQIEQLQRTSPFMGVELKGDAFEIVALSAPEQVVDPTAKWQFNIKPLQVGHQTLTLSVSLQLGQLVPEVPTGARIAVPVFERQIRIRINLSYGTRRFVGSNWQWLVGTGIGAGGTAAAFLTVVH